MNRFIAKLKDESCINIASDKMEICGNGVLAWKGDAMVAYVDLDEVISVHLSEKNVACENG